MALTELLAFVLESRGGEAVTSDLQRIGQAGVQSQTQIQSAAARTEGSLVATGRAGTTAGDAVEDGARRGTSRLQALGDRVGITGDLLRTGIAAGAAVGFGVLIAKAGDAVTAYVDLAGEVRNFQRVSGASAQESSRYVAVFDDLQISSDKAGTALARLARVDPAKLSEYGVEVARAADGTVSLTQTLLNVADAYEATTDPQQRVLLGNAAFGKGFQELIPLLEQGREGLAGYFEGVNEGQIYTQDALDQAREYELALDGLQDAAADFGQSFGREVIPALSGALDAGTGAISVIQGIPGPLAEGAISAGAFAAAGIGLNKMLGGLAGQSSGLGRLAGSLSSFGRFGVAGAALGVAIPLVSALTEQLRGMIVTERDVDDLAVALENLGQTGSSGGAFADMGGLEGFQETLDNFNFDAMIRSGRDLEDFTRLFRGNRGSDFQQASEDLEALDASLAGIASSGNATDARAAFQQFAAAAADSGYSTEQLLALFPQYADALEGADLAQQNAAGSGSALAETSAEVADQIDYAAEATTRLTEALDAQNGSALSLAEADIAVRDAIADFTTKVQEAKVAGDENALSLDRNTQAGRDNESALIDQITAATELSEATARQTGSTEAGREAFEAQIGTIRDNMAALGFNEAQVDALIATYGRVPSNVSTTTIVRDEATGALRAVTSSMDALDGRVSTVTVRQKFIISRTEDVPLSVFDGRDGARATGGSVSAGGTYLVGEVRPELFRPQGSGTIIPNTGVSSGPSRSGPMVSVGQLVVRRESDVEVVAQRLARLSRTGG